MGYYIFGAGKNIISYNRELRTGIIDIRNIVTRLKLKTNQDNAITG